MHLVDRLRSLKELIDEKSEMTIHLDRDINSGNQMGVYLEMRSMSSCNRDTPDQFEDAAERETASRRKIDRAVSTMNKMVQAKEAKSRAALKELLERDGSKLKAYLDRASSLVQMISELQATQASGGDRSSIEHELHGALTKHGAYTPVRARPPMVADRTLPTLRSVSISPLPCADESSLWTAADEELQELARSLQALAAAPAALRCIKDHADGPMPMDVASSADDVSSAASSP